MTADAFARDLPSLACRRLLLIRPPTTNGSYQINTSSELHLSKESACNCACSIAVCEVTTFR